MKRILVIDDSEIVLARLKRALVVSGYDVLTTTQIVGNARHLATCDLAIIDYHMPGLNGSSVVASFRSLAHSSTHECLLFLYTSDEKIATQYARLGFDGSLTSKGDEKALVRQVGAIFRTQAMRADSVRRAAAREIRAPEDTPSTRPKS